MVRVTGACVSMMKGRSRERTLFLSAAVVLGRCTGLSGAQHQHWHIHTFLAGAELEWAMDEVIEEDAAAKTWKSWEWAGRWIQERC